MQRPYEQAVASLVDGLRDSLGERLISVVLFGSVAKGSARPDSDVDVVVVARDLPQGHRRRRALVVGPEERAQELLRRHLPDGWFSLVLKTPDEVELGGPLFYDMTVPGEAEILLDRDGFMESYLTRLRRRMAALGSVRRSLHGHPYWDLKPSWQPGDEIDL